MKIYFYGAAGSVTGSSYLIEIKSGKVLIECGMFQGNKNLRERNYMDFQYNPEEIDAVLITHSHLDHIGLLPKLVKNGYKGPIYATDSTIEIMEVLLYDSARIQESDTEWENKKRSRNGKEKLFPLYTESDVAETMKLVRVVNLHEEFNPIPDFKVKYKDAGHILGSGFLEIKIKEENIEKNFVFSGDLGRLNQSIIRDTETSSNADVVFIESTYGNRNHKTSEDTKKEIADILKDVSRTKGTLIIPAFALGRTQEMIYKFFELFDQHKIPEMKIYVDSPMAKKITEIYAKKKDLYDEEMINYYKDGKNPLYFSELTFTESKEDSIKLNVTPGPKVIISASGMCDAGRIRHHLKHNIWKPDSHILFVGYQAEGTLGRNLIEGAKKVNILGESINVKAKIHTIGGLSAHADKGELLNFLKMFKSSKPSTFIVHGEPEIAEVFSKSVKKELGFNTYIPGWNDIAVLKFYPDKVSIKMIKEEKSTVKNNEYERWKGLIKKVNEHIDKSDKLNIKNKKLAKEMILREINSSVERFLDND